MTRVEALQRAVIDQRDWIKQCGGTFGGYIANYHGRHGRSLEDAEAIFDADQAALRNLERRLAEAAGGRKP